MNTIERLKARVDAQCPDLSSQIRHLVVGALAVFRLRLVDISIREEVLLLHLIEGESYLRAHYGVCYFYSQMGSWDMYPGVVSQNTLGRIRAYLLKLEGMFRLLDPTTERSEDKLVESCRKALGDGKLTTDESLSRFEEVAIRSFAVKGGRKGRLARKGREGRRRTGGPGVHGSRKRR